MILSAKKRVYDNRRKNSIFSFSQQRLVVFQILTEILINSFKGAAVKLKTILLSTLLVISIISISNAESRDSFLKCIENIVKLSLSCSKNYQG